MLKQRKDKLVIKSSLGPLIHGSHLEEKSIENIGTTMDEKKQNKRYALTTTKTVITYMSHISNIFAI